MNENLKSPSYCVYEEIDRLDRFSNGSSEQNYDQSFDTENNTEISNNTASLNSDFGHVIETNRLLPKILYKNYCKTPSFYFKNLNRNQCEALLSGHENGVFLIRDSVYYKGQLTLSFVNNGSYEHYIIERNKYSKNLVSIDQIRWFESINDLIQHYQLYKDNLTTQLTVGLSSNDIALEPDFSLNDKFSISISDLTFFELIGSGEFADVRKGELRNRLVAIKQLKDNASSIRSLLNEADILNSLDHENIIKFSGISLKSKIFLITEYMPNGSLADYLRSRGRNLIGIDELIKFCSNVSSAFEYLESKQICHRDLCACNVLLDKYKLAKISDFGLAIWLNKRNKQTLYIQYPTKVRIKWTAPESLGGKNFSIKSDVWSFGIFLWEVFSFGRIPYPRIAIELLEEHILKGERMKPPENCPNNISQIMNLCWKLKPNERPSFVYLKKIFNNFVNKINN